MSVAMPSCSARRWKSASVSREVDLRPRASLRRRPVSRIEFILAPVEEVLEVGLGLVGGGCEALAWGCEGSDGAISVCMV